MSLSLNNQKKLVDASFVASATLPASANSNVTTTSFNLVQASTASDFYAVQVDIDPMANFGTAGALTVVIQDSADNATFANISELGSTVVNANTTVTTTDQYSLPPTARQYIRGLAAVTGINGSIAANSVTVSLRF